MLGRHVAVAAILGFLTALSGCGGGGGAGSDSGTNALQLSVAAGRLDMAVLEGANAGQGAVSLTARLTGGSGNESVFIGVEVTGQGVLLPIPVDIDTTARTGTATVAPNPSLPAGSYSGTLRVLACLDALCVSPIAGSPTTVNYTSVVQPRFRASVPSLAFAAAESVQPTAQAFAVTLPAGAVSATHTVRYGANANGWLQVQGNGPNFTVRPNAGLSAGTYTADIELDSGTAQPRVTVAVRLNVSAGLVVAPSVETRVLSTSPATVTSGSLPIEAAAGVAATQWSAHTASPWLRLVATSGALGTPLQWNVDPQAFAGLATGTTADAEVTVSAGNGLTPQRVQFRLTKEVAEIETADSLAVGAGEAGEVLLYGRLFDTADTVQRLQARGFTPGAVTVRSPTLLSMQVPALPAGTYELSLATASGLPTRTVQLKVLAPVDRGMQAVATTGLKGALLWDAASQSAFVHNASQSSVMRVQLGGTPSAPTATTTSRVVPGIIGMALSPDRASLVVVTSAGRILDLSTQDLSVLATRETGRTIDQAANSGMPLAVTGDNRLLMSMGSQWGGVLHYDLGRSQSLPLPSGNFTFYSGPWGRVSPNGQRLMLVQSAAISPRPPLLLRDAGDGLLRAFQPEPVSFYFRGSSDRRGLRWALDGTVYSHELVAQGQLEPPSGWYGQESAMSRDGSRTYLFTRNAATSLSMIWVFDTSTPVGAGYNYPVLGSLEPLLQPSCANQVQDDSCNGYATRLVLTDDDRSLLAVGDRQLVVVPLPVGLRGGPLPATASLLRRMGPVTR
jgi:hypothetical protein